MHVKWFLKYSEWVIVKYYNVCVCKIWLKCGETCLLISTKVIFCGFLIPKILDNSLFGRNLRLSSWICKFFSLIYVFNRMVWFYLRANFIFYCKYFPFTNIACFLALLFFCFCYSFNCWPPVVPLIFFFFFFGCCFCVCCVLLFGYIILIIIIYKKKNN